MNKIAISLAIGASALFVTAATAAPLMITRSVAPDSDVQNVAVVCDQNGRCWRQRSERRVYRESYGYAAPRQRYIHREGYGQRNGVTLNAPGVSVGIGTSRY
jgi:hypothetical protein